jgi:hypothetical protein
MVLMQHRVEIFLLSLKAMPEGLTRPHGASEDWRGSLPHHAATHTATVHEIPSKSFHFLI